MFYKHRDSFVVSELFNLGCFYMISEMLRFAGGTGLTFAGSLTVTLVILAYHIVDDIFWAGKREDYTILYYPVEISIVTLVVFSVSMLSRVPVNFHEALILAGLFVVAQAVKYRVLIDHTPILEAREIESDFISLSDLDENEQACSAKERGCWIVITENKEVKNKSKNLKYTTYSDIERKLVNSNDPVSLKLNFRNNRIHCHFYKGKKRLTKNHSSRYLFEAMKCAVEDLDKKMNTREKRLDIDGKI